MDFQSVHEELRHRSGRPDGLEVHPTEPPRSIDPVAADITPDDLEHFPAIVDRLAELAIGPLNLLAGETCDPSDLLAAAKLANSAGLTVTVRGRATELAKAGFREELRKSGVASIECLFLSAVAEVHDELAGAGDCRLAKSLFAAAEDNLPVTALIALVPATLDTLDRTLDYLVEHGVRHASFFAIVSADEAPSRWALSSGQLVSTVARITSQRRKAMAFDWFPPQRFVAQQTLAQQIRRGPRARWNAIRVECDGSVILPFGPWHARGNLLDSLDYVPKIEFTPPGRCADCPSVALCEPGCIRDPAAWA